VIDLRRYTLAAVLLFTTLGSGGTDPFVMMIVHGLLLTLVALELLYPSQRSPFPGTVLAPSLCFGAVALTGAALAPHGYAAFSTLQEGFAFAAVVWLAYRYGRRFHMILFQTLVAGGVVQALYVIVRRVFLGEWRSPGTFFNPNHLAAWLVLVLLLMAGTWDRRPALRDWLMRGGAGVLIFAAVVLSGSRGALVGLAAGSLYLLARVWRSIGRREKGLAILSGLILAVVVSSALVIRFQGPDRFAFHRLSIWKGTADLILDHPLIGVGPGQFDWAAEQVQFPDGEPPLNFDHRFNQTHSDWLRLPAEFGLSGMLFLLAAMIGLGFMIRDREKESVLRVAGTIAALIAMLTQAAFQNLSHRPGVYLAVAGLIGTVVALTTSSAGGEGDSAGRVRGVRAGRFQVVAVALLLVLFLTADVGPWLADGFARSARRGDPVTNLRKAILLNRVQPWYHMRLAEQILKAEDDLTLEPYLAARLEAEAALRLHPRSGELALRMARIEAAGCRELFRDAASRARAYEWYLLAERLLPARPLVPQEAGEFLYGVTDLSGAAAAADRVLALEPNAVKARLLKAAALFEIGGRNRTAQIALLLTEAAELEEQYAGLVEGNPMIERLLRADSAWKSGIRVPALTKESRQGEIEP